MHMRMRMCRPALSLGPPQVASTMTPLHAACTYTLPCTSKATLYTTTTQVWTGLFAGQIGTKHKHKHKHEDKHKHTLCMVYLAPTPLHNTGAHQCIPGA
jgi:hypothetical protein